MLVTDGGGGEEALLFGGREAAADFTGQDRVKNKTAANSNTRVLQGLSMTPSFLLSPKPRSASLEGLPSPGAVAFGVYANNRLPGNTPGAALRAWVNHPNLIPFARPFPAGWSSGL